MADAYQNNLSLKIPFGDPAGSTTYEDLSGVTKTVTNLGDVKISPNASKWYSTSAEFDGVGDGIEFSHPTAWQFAGEDWTIEGWVKAIGSETNCVVSTVRNSASSAPGGVGPQFAGNGGWGGSSPSSIERAKTKASNGTLGQGGNGTSTDAGALSIGGGGGGGGGGYFGGGGGSAAAASRFILVNTNTIDATLFGPVVSIDEISSQFSNLDALPESGYIKFILKKTPDNVTVSAYFLRNGTTFSLSGISTNGLALDYVSATTSILFYTNDDHDTLWMDADGSGIIARWNTDTLSGNFDKFKGDTVLLSDVPLTQAATYDPQTALDNYGTFIAFPQTVSGMWVNISDGTYSVNGGTVTTLPEDLATVFTGDPANGIWTISDSINQFLVGRFDSTTAYIVTVNLQTRLIENYTAVELTVEPEMLNYTEEDAIGVQLFAVNGASSFQQDTFFYTGTIGWKVDPTPLSEVNKTAFSAGVISTQTGMDIITTIDGSGNVWFADWGHDNGGLFGIGNDDRLNLRKTNITLVPAIVSDVSGVVFGDAGGGGGGSNFVSETLSSRVSLKGNVPFDSPTGEIETGHAGNGFCRIIRLSDGAVTDFDFTGSVQTFITPTDGLYEIRTWGAQGQGTSLHGVQEGGRGGFAKGTAYLISGQPLYVYVGGQNGYNGGGLGGISGSENGGNGGGATDVRTIQGDLASRLIVAGGGGGNGGASSTSTNPTTGLGGGAGLTGSSGINGGPEYGIAVFFDYQARCFWAIVKFTDNTAVVLKDFYEMANVAEFNHFMLTRAGNVLRLFRNGILTDSADIGTKVVSGSTYFYIGCINDVESGNQYGVEYSFNGYMNDIRVTKGISRKTADFTPPIRFLTMYQVSGKVTDENGVAAQRKIRMYNSESGQLVKETLSDPETGNYYLETNKPGEHYLVGLDDGVGTPFNHIIIRVMPSELPSE